MNVRVERDIEMKKLLLFSPLTAAQGDGFKVVVRDRMIRQCGMFKFHQGRYLTGVKNFKSEYTVDTVQVDANTG